MGVEFQLDPDFERFDAAQVAGLCASENSQKVIQRDMCFTHAEFFFVGSFTRALLALQARAGFGGSGFWGLVGVGTLFRLV